MVRAMIECLEIDRYSPRPDLVRKVVKVLNGGDLVACPTDTTYGVFARLDHRDASERLQRLRTAMAGSEQRSRERHRTAASSRFMTHLQVALDRATGRFPLLFT